MEDLANTRILFNLDHEPEPVTRQTRAGLISLHLSAITLAAWAGSGNPLWIAVGAPLVLGGLLAAGTRRRSAALAGSAAVIALIGSLSSEWRLDRLAREWPERAESEEQQVQDALADAFEALLVTGETTVAEVAALWAEGAMAGELSLPSDLRTPSVHALAVFGPSGQLLAWDGSHQGAIPDPVRFAESRYIYEEGALFGYLYVTQPLAGGGAVVAGSLLRSDLPPGLEAPAEDFESAFLERVGATIEIASADQVVSGSVWDLEWEGEILFSVTLAPAFEAAARESLELSWVRFVALLVLLSWFLAVLGGRADTPSVLTGAVALPVVLLVLPLARITGWADLFSPAVLLLPTPIGLTLGDLAAVGAAAVVALGIIPWRRLPRLPVVPTSVGAIAVAWAGLKFLELGPSRDLLAGDEAGWIVLQASAVALILIPLTAAALLVRERQDARLRLIALCLSLGVATALAVGWVGLLEQVAERPIWLPFLWVLPLLVFVRSLPASLDWPFGLIRVSGAVVISASLVLPWAWDLRVDARMAVAEERIERLGTRSDPFLEFLLTRAGEHASELAAADRQAVEVLYRSWSETGLAAEGLPLWITYWSSRGTPQEELRIGVSEERPPIPSDMLATARIEDEVQVRRFDLADTHYVAVAPLTAGSFLSVVVPPRRMLESASPLGPLFSPSRSEPDPLVMIPLLPGEVPGETEGVRWIRTAEGWQGETFIAYPDEVYHAHYRLESPGWLLLFARGSLLLLLNFTVLGVLWGLGRGMVGGGRAETPWSLALPGSFRSRVTVALFAFFLLPSIVFGTLAYRTLAGATIRTAESLAERAVEDAGRRYFEVAGVMDLLASGVGSDLLLYENGELVGGSPIELIQLGLYQGWVPPEIQEVMLTGEAAVTAATASLGGWEYVVAYRRMPGARVLAAPTPLQAGATALRQRDVADLIAFALIVGGILSVLLALGVGRALARPIQTLRVASERVGAGNMSVQLPETRTDEFGAVFDAFNRMVDRLAKTRKALLRSSRRTRAIVEELAIGVVALDPHGRVRLANPIVEKLFGEPVERDQLLPRGTNADDARAALADWVDGYFRDELREAGTEFSFGDRRVRVRARRTSRSGPGGGVVLTLEDVTDELRIERVLAWGEMAQQVAHEVKNPLTPIKLGVQHIRRAWIDRQPDFEEILERNIGAILDEIDRLASVASSFSRFAAPSPAGAEPLEPVALAEVAREVLELYGVGGGPMRFELVDGREVPLARGRVAEVKEVLVNLLENARAALPGGGRVKVEIESVEGEIEVRVVDDGLGIPPEVLPRIFEPHFSTRSSGTGLGLAIVQRLVEGWGGRVQAESRPGDGTVIRVRMLPWNGRPRDHRGGQG